VVAVRARVAIAITIVFSWPAAQAIWYSFCSRTPSALKDWFVGLQNYVQLFSDSHYLDSFKVPRFSASLSPLSLFR
jgi:ABC-type sugar transport system permease subunit